VNAQRLAAAGLAVALAAAFPMPAASADAAIPPPYINRVTWVNYSGLDTLRVYPSAAGREVAGDFDKTTAQSDEAWGEVVALAPDGDTPGMRAQFLCHWRFAEFAQPGKTSWDLEPWRPAVDDDTMLLAGCNPGGAERG
jgi:hypothetical protein